MKRRLVLALGALSLAAAAMLISRGSRQERLRFVYNTQAMSAEERLTLSKPPWQLLTRDLEPDVRIQYGLSRSTVSDAPWLVYFPGNDKTQLQTGSRVLTMIRGDHPAHLIVLSYRGFSGNLGEPEVGAIERDNISLVSALMVDHVIQPHLLHLVGFSIGGYFSAHLAAELAQRNQAPASLTLLAPGYELVMVRPSFFQRLVPGDDYQMAPFLPRIVSRSLVLQGTADDAFMGPGQGQTVAEILGRSGRCTYQEFAGEKHSTLLDNEQALALAREFIWK